MSNRLTIKGQVTVPKNVREFLGLTAGASAVEFSIDPDGAVRVRKAAVKPRKSAAVPDNVLRPGPINRCDQILALLSGCPA